MPPLVCVCLSQSLIFMTIKKIQDHLHRQLSANGTAAVAKNCTKMMRVREVYLIAEETTHQKRDLCKFQLLAFQGFKVIFMVFELIS